jgi:hypothetical protein
MQRDFLAFTQCSDDGSEDPERTLSEIERRINICFCVIHRTMRKIEKGNEKRMQ